MIDPSDEALRRALRSCLSVERWVAEVALAAPFGSTDALLDAARAATPFSEDEIDEALGDHPRIGEKHEGTSAAAEFSRKEQASLGDEDPALADAIAAGNAEYERRFGRVFLIRAAGRSRADILAELRRRTALDAPTELATVSHELRDITLLRLETLYHDPAARAVLTGESLEE